MSASGRDETGNELRKFISKFNDGPAPLSLIHTTDLLRLGQIEQDGLLVRRILILTMDQNYYIFFTVVPLFASIPNSSRRRILRLRRSALFSDQICHGIRGECTRLILERFLIKG